MAKVTSKLQVTVPKAIATRYRIGPGDEIEWIPAEDVIHVRKKKENRPEPGDVAAGLELFDRATERQQQRQSRRDPCKEPADRGWTREDLYDRGGAD